MMQEVKKGRKRVKKKYYISELDGYILCLLSLMGKKLFVNTVGHFLLSHGVIHFTFLSDCHLPSTHFTLGAMTISMRQLRLHL